jgi:PAS domain S-box-containing protein
MKKQSQKKVIQGDNMWELTFNAVPDAIAIIDTHHRIQRVNKTMADRLGLRPEQCVGMFCHSLVHGLKTPPPFCPHARLLKEGHEQREEVHEERMGGTFIVTTSPLMDEAGQLRGSVHVARDITERKQIEDKLLSLNRELLETNTNLKAAYQWMRDNRDLLREGRYEEDFGFLVDRDGQIKWISERALSYTGQSTSKLLAGNVLELFQASCRDRLKQALKQAWIGIVDPIQVEFASGTQKERVFEAKITRLTSREKRRLWMVLHHPAQKTAQNE